MSLDSWTTQFESDDEFRRLDRAADKSGFLDVFEGIDEPTQITDRDEFQYRPEIEGYQLENVIGKGGTSVVFRATRAHDAQQVAIKVLNRGSESGFNLRFRREIQAMACLDHDGIAKCLDYGITREGHPFLVLQLIVGRPIDAYCNDECLSTSQRVKLLIQVCDAVAFAHAHDVLHRDLKPGNVMVENNGKPVVTDFGLAKLTGLDDLQTEDRTRTGAVLGTLNYLAPEQIHSLEGNVSKSTDIFGLGALLHVLLVGCPPFQFRNIVDALAEYYDRYPVRLQSDSNIPVEIEAVCIKCLAPKPTDRYSSVQQLQTDLQRFIDGRAVTAKRQLFRRRLDVFTRQYPWFARLAIAIVTAIFITAIAFLVLWQQSSRHLSNASRLDRQRQETLREISSTLVEIEADPSTIRLQEKLLLILSQSNAQMPGPARTADDFFVSAEIDFMLGQVRHHLSKHDEKAKDYQRALEGFRKAVGLDPGHEAACFGLFHSLFALREYHEANSAIDELLMRYPENNDYLDAKVSAVYLLGRHAFEDSEFEQANEFFRSATHYHSLLRSESNKSSTPNDVRRNCKLDSMTARLEIVEGNLARALVILELVLEEYEKMEFLQSPKASACEEYFQYLKLAISVAAYKGDEEAVQRLFTKCVACYQKARTEYSGFVHYRFFFLTAVFEYGVWARRSNLEQEEGVAIDLLHRGLTDWEEAGLTNDDYYKFSYMFLSSELSDSSDVRTQKITIARQRLRELPFQALSCDLASAIIKDQLWDEAGLVDYLTTRLSGRPKEIRARRYLTNLQSLPAGHRHYQGPITSEDRLIILAQSTSFFQSQFDKAAD